MVMKWSKMYKMELHEEKFEVVSYTCTLNGPKTMRLMPFYPQTVEYCTGNGHVIEPQEIVRDLGVYVSYDRSWTTHIEKAVQGARLMAAWVLSAFRDRSAPVMLTLQKPCKIKATVALSGTLLKSVISRSWRAYKDASHRR